MTERRSLFLKQGLTLIELLIVVGIVLILAGIAAENYMAASIRAKVARVHSEHRTLMTAIEAYRADHNQPPRMAHRTYQDPAFDIIQGMPVAGVMSRALSTPVAYVTRAHLIDPFMEANLAAPLDERLYTYQVIPQYIEWNPDSTFWPMALEFYGDWRLGSVGPDRTFGYGFANSAQLPYDPTNGIVSLGNIWRGQRGLTGIPPVPDMLGEH